MGTPPQRVLIVDDSATQAKQLEWILENAGFAVRVLRDSTLVLDCLRAEEFAALLSDVVMPDLSGYDLCRQVKSDPLLKHLPVILLTTLSSPSDIVEGLACGADNFVTKPYDPGGLVTRLRAILHGRKPVQESESGGLLFPVEGRLFDINSSKYQILTFLLSTFEDYMFTKSREREAMRKVMETRRLADAQLEENEQKLHRAAEELSQHRRIGEELAQAKAAVEAESLAKNRFLATMSHALRTPLNGIIGMSQLLSTSDELSAEHQEYARLLTKSSVDLAHLVDDVLDLSKIESEHLEHKILSFSISELVRELHTIFTPRARSKGIDLVATVSASLPGSVCGDERHVRRVLMNLIENAVEFTERGQIRLDVTADDGSTMERVMTVFRVSDTGVGIPSDRLEDIFAPFTQADDSSTRAYDGTGLGLTIARRLATFLDGTLTVTSQKGRGSTFTLTVPFATDEDDHPDEPSSVPATVAIATLEAMGNRTPEASEQRRVLLVDDNPINRKVGARILAKLGWQCDVVDDGQQAIDAVLDHGERYQLVLMDCLMPNMDGYSATAMIREKESRHPRTPIVALTAAVMAEDRLRCFESGMDHVLSKPIDVEALCDVLDNYALPYERSGRNGVNTNSDLEA